MSNFKEEFKNWINNKVDYQLEVIDEISSEIDIYPGQEWFSLFLNRTATHYSSTDFLDVLLSNFIFYLNCEFERELLNYFQPAGYNIYNEPYLSLGLNLKYRFEGHGNKAGLFVKKKNKKKFRKSIKTLTLSQRENLMKNKFFSYIVIKTNLKIYSKNDIRALKLRSLSKIQ